MLNGPPTRARRDDRGTVAMLVPAAVLIVLVLSAIAIDLSVRSMAQRRLYQIVAAAADDAAAQIDTREYRISGERRISSVRARSVATAAVSVAELPGALDGPIEVRVTDRRVEVQAAVRVAPVFAQTAPARVTATAAAEI